MGTEVLTFPYFPISLNLELFGLGWVVSTLLDVFAEVVSMVVTGMKAEMLTNKQQVFDDFIACSQWLIDNNWTQPSKLAIQGGSNGGLLVGRLYDTTARIIPERASPLLVF